VAHAVRSAKDVHVAACAHYLIAANAYGGGQAVALVTRNTKDFRKGELAKLGIALRKPDEFLAALFQGDPQAFSAAFRHFRTDLSLARSRTICWRVCTRTGRYRSLQP